jgi:hypothetical protein
MELGLFIGLSVVSILAFGAMYFIAKEILRVTPSHRKAVI